jgi:hypothetical protein
MNLSFTYTDRKTLIQDTEIPRFLRQKLSVPTEGPLALTPYELKTLTTTTLKAYTCHNHPQTRQCIKQVLNKILAAGKELYNPPESRPVQPLTGDLTSIQIENLTTENWAPDTPGVQLRLDLSPDDVITTPIIKRAKIFLQTLSKNGTKATNAGNLNRNFVRSMINRMDCLSQYAEDPACQNKTINEAGVPPLETLRIVMELAKIIEIKKRRFQVTVKGRDLMEQFSEENLFLVLFVYWFRVFNLGFKDKLMNIPEFQECFGYSLYQLSLLDSGWQDIEQMSEKLIMPSLAEKIPAEPYNFRQGLVEGRFLRNLELFGLVEVRREKDPQLQPLDWPVQAFRKTGLLGRFVGFGFS